VASCFLQNNNKWSLDLPRSIHNKMICVLWHFLQMNDLIQDACAYGRMRKILKIDGYWGKFFEKYFPFIDKFSKRIFFSIYVSIRSFFPRIVSIVHSCLCWSSISLIIFRSFFIWVIMVQNASLVFSSFRFFSLMRCH